mgnify:CR=1 FL=1
MSSSNSTYTAKQPEKNVWSKSSEFSFLLLYFVMNNNSKKNYQFGTMINWQTRHTHTHWWKLWNFVLSEKKRRNFLFSIWFKQMSQKWNHDWKINFHNRQHNCIVYSHHPKISMSLNTHTHTKTQNVLQLSIFQRLTIIKSNDILSSMKSNQIESIE